MIAYIWFTFSQVKCPWTDLTHGGADQTDRSSETILSSETMYVFPWSKRNEDENCDPKGLGKTE